MKRWSIVGAVSLAVALGVVMGGVLDRALSRRGPDTRVAEVEGGLARLEGKVKDLDDTLAGLAGSVESLRIELEEARALTELEDVPLVSLQAAMALDCSDPTQVTVATILRSLDLRGDLLEPEQLVALETQIAGYREALREIPERIHREMDAAADDLERKGEYFTQNHRDAMARAKASLDTSGESVASHYRDRGDGGKYFVIRLREHPALARAVEEKREAPLKFKRAVHEILNEASRETAPQEGR